MPNFSINFSYREIGCEETELLQQIFNLRVECRNTGEITFEKFPNGWWDEMDKYSKHYAIFYHDIIIAAGRLTFFKSFALHPFYYDVAKYLPTNLNNVQIAYLSKDQVLPKFRGLGFRDLLLRMREQACIAENIFDLIIDIDTNSRQYLNFKKDGYNALGIFSLDKTQWPGLEEGILMHKNLLL